MIILQFILCLYSALELVLANDYVKLHPSDNNSEIFEGYNHAVLCDAPGATVISWFNPERRPISDKRNNDVYSEKVNQTEIRLMIFNVSQKHRGTYSCYARVNETEQAEKFELTVIKPITFVDNPTIYDETEGTSVTLLCKAESSPPASISWTFNGTMLENGDGYNILPEGLHISNITPEKFGRYSCNADLVTNQHGTTKPFVITLKQARAPVIIPLYKDNIIYGALETEIIIRCKVEANPSAIIRWIKNYKFLNSPEYHIETRENESILKIYLSNSRLFGNYTCHANNRLGDDEVILQLLRGEKPNPPKLDIRERLDTVLRFDLQKIVNQSLKNYRIRYKLDDNNSTDWNITDFDLKESDTTPYSLNDLQPNTDYVLEAGACTEIDLCAYTKEEHFKTNQITTNSGNSVAWTIVMHTIILLPAVLINHFSY